MDAYLKKSRTDIEYNGFYHDAEEDRAIDEERKNALASMGYGIITVSRYSFMHASAFVRVMEAIQRKEGIRPSRSAKRLSNHARGPETVCAQKVYRREKENSEAASLGFRRSSTNRPRKSNTRRHHAG